MSMKVFHQIIWFVFTVAVLAACAKPAEIVSQGPVTDVEVSFSQITKSSLKDCKLSLSPTTESSTVNTINSISTKDNRLGKRVERTDELSGTWSYENKVVDIQVISLADLSWGTGVVRMHGLPMPGGHGWDCDVIEWFAFDEGYLTWGDPTFPCMSNAWTT